ncbi:MAG: hypothetical protein LBS31_10130, partial [Candidatus Adiutrix sp.]|nr:hypothetical protein [Candidatus Adiutrix sp.]
MKQRPGGGLSALYDLCRASGGSAALLERAVRAAGVVPDGGRAFSSAGVAAALSEAYRAGGGSSALFEARLRRRFGSGEGGKKFLAVLSLACLMQTTLA